MNSLGNTGAQLDIWLEGGLGGNISHEKFFGPP